MKHTKQTKHTRKDPALNRPWASYAAASAGLMAVAGVTHSADAAVLYTDITDLTIATGAGISFDLGEGGSPQAQIFNEFGSPPPGTSFMFETFYNANTPKLRTVGSRAVAGYYTLKLGAGDTIGAALPWHSGGVTYLDWWGAGNWQGGGEGYVGLRVENGGDFNYGWARVEYIDTNDLVNNTFTLKDFAIETTPGVPIQAGAVPEPSHAVLLALGLGGAALRRRRKVAV